MVRRLSVAVCLLGFAGLASVAITQAPADSAFEVASVKQNRSDAADIIDVLPSGVFSATNVTLRQLIPIAYGIPLWHAHFAIAGAPDWTASERFDVLAKAPAPASVDHVRLMLRTLLADRFQLRTHKQIRELAVYALIVARTDRRLGPGLVRSATDCEALRKGTPPPFEPGRRIPCGARRTAGNLSGGGLTLAGVANHLAGFLDRPVLDRTGVEGAFDFDLLWTPDQQALPLDDLAARADANLPSIFTAVQEQWGLKLDAQRGPVEVLVIDHVERPTPD